MAFQRGPGEGYHAAKAAALRIDPSLRCRALVWDGRIDGYVVERGGALLGTGRIARDAWGDALSKLRPPRGRR